MPETVEPEVFQLPAKKQKKPKAVELSEPEPQFVQQPVKKQKKLKPAEIPDPEPEIVYVKKQKKSKTVVIPEPELQRSSKHTKTDEPVERKLSKKQQRALDEVVEPAERVQPVAKKSKTAKAETHKEKKRLNILTKMASPESVPQSKVVAKQPTEYNVLQARSLPTPANAQAKNASRKRKIVKKPSPQWTSAGEFLVSKIIPTVLRENVVHSSARGTDFVVTSLSKKRKVMAAAIQAAESSQVHVAEYRHKATNSDRVKRETTAQMLQHKKKMQAFTRF